MRALIFFSIFFATAARAESQKAKEAIQYLQSLNQMRENLASTLDSRAEPITEGTFKEVCLPVGKALKAWGKKRGYPVKQVAEKNRNPDHALSAEDKPIFDLFERNPKKQSHVAQVKEKGIATGERVWVRIPVVQSCLHCHGAADQRPEFIRLKYPNDKAYGFQVGDLRGLYTAFIPEYVSAASGKERSK